MSRSFEDILRTIIREETEVICRKAQEETIKILEAKTEKTIKILEANTEKIVREIDRLHNGKPAVSTDSIEHGSDKTATATEGHYPTLTNNASSMANYSKVFKSMPDLSSSDEHGQGRQSSLPRYKKTADGIRATSIDHQTSIKKKIAVQKSYSKPCLGKNYILLQLFAHLGRVTYM